MRSVLLLMSALVVLGGCAGRASGGDSVAVAAYPLEFLVTEIARDEADAFNLSPAGAEPHDVELTPSQVRSLADADLVVYVGSGFQPAVEDALSDVETRAFDVLTTTSTLPASDEHGSHEEGLDPHVWLDPARFSEVARSTADELADVFPEHAESFESRAAGLISKLEELDREIRGALRDCDRRTIVTSHRAFGYLADAYDLEEIGIAGVDPEGEASPGRLSELARFVESSGVTTVFFESLVPAATAETLADEAGVRTARLDPLESAPASGDYFSAMRQNLAALTKGLGCR